jgi:hypothetical protein
MACGSSSLRQAGAGEAIPCRATVRAPGGSGERGCGRRWRGGGAVLLGLAFAAGALEVAGAEGGQGVDPGGVVDGRAAMKVEAFLDREAGFLDPATLTVRMTPHHDPDLELEYPAGAWFAPPDAVYDVWVEGPGVISAPKGVFHYDPDPAISGGRGYPMAFRLRPGGTLRLGAGGGPADDLQVRFLHVDCHVVGGNLGTEFARRVTAAGARAGVMMPAGTVVGALYDASGRTCMAQARPVEVERGGIAEIRFTAPARRRLFAVWYAVPPGGATVEVTSPTVWARPVEVSLGGGRVHLVEVDLLRKPTLGVSLQVPEELSLAGAKLRVETVPGGAAVRERELEGPSSRVELLGMPPEELQVVLQTERWRFSRAVDLGDGEDREVAVDPEPAWVSGRVVVGEETARATVGFATNRSTAATPVFAEAETDHDGAYRVLLFPEAVAGLTQVDLADDSTPPVWELLKERIVDGLVYDFTLPDGRVTVRVLQSDDGQPVGGARVRCGWAAEDGSSGARELTTDERGEAVLPPLPPSRVTLTATAPGFRRARSELAVEEGEEREAVLTLEREGETVEVAVVTPAGTAAAGARAAVFRSQEEPPIWTGEADGEGSLRVPTRFDGLWLAVASPPFGFVVERWRVPTEGGGMVRLPNGGDLTVRAIAAGEAPQAFSPLALWVGPERVGSRALAWLTGTPAMTDREGAWRGLALPATELAVMVAAVTSADAANRFSSGQLDYRRTSITSPWPPVVTVEAVIP